MAEKTFEVTVTIRFKWRKDEQSMTAADAAEVVASGLRHLQEANWYDDDALQMQSVSVKPTKNGE